MKTNKLFLSIFAALFCAMTIISCGNDDENNDGDKGQGGKPTTNKRVADLTGVIYDEQGRITYTPRLKINVTYGKDKIEVNGTSDDNYEFTHTYILNEKGLIVSGPLGEFEYDDNNRLIKQSYEVTNFGVTSKVEMQYVWDDGNIVERAENRSGKLRRIQTFEYSTDEYIGDVAEYIGYPDNFTNDEFLIDYGYFGVRCKNLCTRINEYDLDGKEITRYLTYDYTLDNEGYVTKVVEKIITPNGQAGSYVTNISYRNLE